MGYQNETAVSSRLAPSTMEPKPTDLQKSTHGLIERLSNVLNSQELIRISLLGPMPQHPDSSPAPPPSGLLHMAEILHQIVGEIEERTAEIAKAVGV